MLIVRKNNAEVSLLMKAGFQDNLLIRQGDGKLALAFTGDTSPQVRVLWLLS